MPKENNTVLVSPIEGEQGLRFRVESWSQPSQPHLVDLSVNEGGGECTCKQWQCRSGPAIKKGADPFSKEGSCRHIRAVHRYWLRHCLAAVVKAHKQGTTS